MNKKPILIVASAVVALGVVGSLSASHSSADTVYRNYNKRSGEHLYTSHYEWTTLPKIASDWTQDSVTFDEPATGANIYRVYNPNSGEHLFTSSSYESSQLVKIGWRSEGVAFHSGGKVPVYRLYNPAAGIGAHLDTASAYEKNQLVKVGWKYEGIAWYALSQGAVGSTPAPAKPSAPSQPQVPVNHVYQATCRGKNDEIIASQNFNSDDDAANWAVNYANSHLSTVYSYRIMQLS
ncbi:hypothetical protein [Lactococcus lactis]|uniref:hypothetical protein n=1 Tax=Lactococcus lactis TaxID=1358 RepID=UPI0018C75E2E|nr:hypothetical protein [Lactococcus lactis]MBG1279297.1 hypothetical protein [Lactococcus lactis subsp. lactis]